MRGRFAPSPTGHLHLGNARTALLAWLSARSQKGRFLLRVEDLDKGRCRTEYVDALFRDLEYLGLDYDEAPIFQSQRNEAYEEAVQALSKKGLVYPCFCTRAEIAQAASAPHGPMDDGPVYPGTCRGLSKEEVKAKAAKRPGALRFLAPSRPITFHDGLAGTVTANVATETGDFVIRRNDNVASYQLAVVVDDAFSNITEVLRGDDLLSSTARQISLYEALENPLPKFIHVPLVMGEDNKRMAKRHGASTVTVLRENRVPAEKVLGLLAFWSGLSDGRPTTASELVVRFSLASLSKRTPIARASELDALLSDTRV